MKEIKLTDAEIVVLDGRCSPATQIEVESAKARISMAADAGVDEAVAGVVVAAIDEARRSGRLIWRKVRLGYCPLCKSAGGYAPYKSGPKRGTPNYAKPRSLAGVEMQHRSVTVTFGGQSSIGVGACAACVEKMLPLIRAGLRSVAAEIPEQLREPGAPALRRFDRRRCKGCGWTGHEGEMGRVATLFFNGSFPGICPSCGVARTPLGPELFDAVEGFDVVVTP